MVGKTIITKTMILKIFYWIFLANLIFLGMLAIAFVFFHLLIFLTLKINNNGIKTKNSRDRIFN
jgi:hypothetical protein